MREERSSFREFYPALCGFEQKVETVEQYMRAVDNAYRVLWNEEQLAADIKYSPRLWFRGLRSSDYPLLPSIGRKELHVEAENTFLLKFKARALTYMDRASARPGCEGANAYWDWLFLMQYYSVPTRLMDWSEDALVALLFAIDPDASPEEKINDAAVWCLNPVKLNTAFTFHDYYPPGYIPNVQEKGVYEMFGPFKTPFQNRKPAAVYAPMNNPRIIVQRGTFTVFPYIDPFVDMREIPDSSDYLLKIVISGDFREALNEQLRRYGLTKAQLMPELSSAAREIFREEI